MKGIEERAILKLQYEKDFLGRNLSDDMVCRAYIKGATEQKTIDEEVRLKKSDSMTQAEYDREVAFADWYHQNGKGTPTYSDAIEWTRRELIDKACKIVRNIINEYFGDGEQSCKVEDTFRKAMKE